MVHEKGLSHWVFNATKLHWKKPAIQWPHMNIAIDQGSDGLAAMWWLFMMCLCATFWLDFSHGAWRSVQGMMTDVGLKPWWLLMMIMFNVAHGPWNDDYRYGQITECWKQLKQNMRPEELPLFMDKVARMIEDMGVLGRGMGSDMTAKMFAECVEEPPLKRKGYKCNLNRFFGGIKVAREQIPQWHKLLFCEEHVVIEEGMMPNKMIEPLKAKPQQGDFSKSTDSDRTSTMDRALRSQCQNSLVMAVILRGDSMNNWLCRIVVTIAEPVELWHGNQSKVLRDCNSSVKWLGEQHSGHFAAHVCQIAKRLGESTHLEFCRFDIPALGINMDFDEGTIALQDDLADTYGQMSIILIKHRWCKTGLWLLHQWPHEAASGLPFEGAATIQHSMGKFMKKLRGDYSIFTWLLLCTNKTACINDLIARSVFKQQAVLQLVQAQ